MLLLKAAHVLLAVIALGGSLTFPIWRRRAELAPDQLAFTLRGIRWIDRRVVIPAYALQLVTGVALALAGGIPLTAGWLVASVALYAGAMAIGIAVLGPAGRRQLALVDSGDTATAEYRRLDRLTRRAELVAVAAVVAIAGLMVLKPF